MFKQRKNKRFNYKSRFGSSDSESYRKESKDDFETKWGEVKETSKRRGSIFASLPVLIIILVSLFVLMYVLDGYI